MFEKTFKLLISNKKNDKLHFEHTDLTRTLSAPRGVTREAGAKAYARKFVASPTATERELGSKTLLRFV